jgi:hypothetical protein
VLQRYYGHIPSPRVSARHGNRWRRSRLRSRCRARGRRGVRGDGFGLHRSSHAGTGAPIYGRAELTGKFSQFVIAGAAIGVVAPAFQDWHKAFWDNLATTIQLHRIKKVIAIDHRDCGAAKIAYGEAKVATPQAETETHRAALAEFRKQVGQRHPQLGVQTGLMALDGKMEMFS